MGVTGVYWGLAGTVGTLRPEGVWGHQGHLEAPRGVGQFWGCWGVGVCWGLAGTVGTQGPEGV